jgi:hypothetical protein
MSDRFHDAVVQVRAEQFLQEKRASARGVDVVTLTNLVSTADSIEDRELFKLAAFFSPDNPMEAYATLGGKVKVAEPPPPKGMSVKAWDKVLDKGPAKTVARVLDVPRARVMEVAR